MFSIRRIPRAVFAGADPAYQVTGIVVYAVALGGAEWAATGWLARTPALAAAVAGAIPVAAVPMYARLALGPGPALLQAVLLSMVAALLPSPLPLPAVQTAVAGVTGGLLVAASTRRGTVGAAGIWAGAAAAVVLALAGRSVLPVPVLLSGMAGTLMGGALSGALVLTLSPVAERVFRHVTTLTLLESLSYDHPLLRRLMTTAPGTFLHSTHLAVLGDAAAHAIGANALAVRVGALYHDIGKTNAPEFFTENQEADNPHDRLPPAESARILRAHVTDGVRLVTEYRLGPRVADFVREHHGTAVMRSLRDKPGADAYDPAVFRYPGPRPRSRETGLLMIADQVEATARAVLPASLEESRALVVRTVDRIRAEHQLDESGLSDADLEAITSVLAEVVQAIHHRRMAYPEGAPVEPSPPRSPLARLRAGRSRG